MFRILTRVAVAWALMIFTACSKNLIKETFAILKYFVVVLPS